MSKNLRRVGGNDVPKVPALPAQVPVQIVHAETIVRIVLVCGCAPPGTVLVITNHYQPVECPRCRSRFFVDLINYDLRAASKQEGFDGNISKVPTSLNIDRAAPAIIPAGALPTM